MDTLKMIEEAIKNPGLQYECFRGRVHYKKGVLEWIECGSKFFIWSQTINLKWRRILQPVDFITAIKAYDDNNTIICLFNDFQNIYTPKKGKNSLINDKGNIISSAEILHGEWYIKNE